MTTLLLSLHPQHARAVLDGRKTLELRRVRPRLNAGDRVLIYATAPVSSLVGVARVSGVLSASPKELWPVARGTACVRRRAFDAYFAGRPQAHGIVLESVAVMDLGLGDLRRVVPEFRPPQSYWYLRSDRTPDAALLRLVNRRRAAA